MTEQAAQSQAPRSHCIFCHASDFMKKTIDDILPSEAATDHFRQARVEFLRGIRRILDDRIERVQGGRKGTHVVVE
jgi:hypothetical protein